MTIASNFVVHFFYLYQAQRRSSEAGKRNFRSKRFSRNLERDPNIRRSNSLQVNRTRLPNEEPPELPQNQNWVETQKGTLRSKNRSVSR